MKLKLIVTLLLLAAGLSFSFIIMNTKQEEEKPMTLNEFNEKIKGTDKPVLVYFNATWCTVCKKVKPILSEIESELKENLEILKIDTDVDKEVANEFDVHALPVLILYNHANREWVHVGIINKSELKQKILPYTWDKKKK